jgi:hypothetical protein
VSEGGACAPGELSCNGTCIPENAQNCGSCGNVCTTMVAHAHPACDKGSCSFECDSSYAACSGACVDLQSDPNNCNACGRSCNGGQCSAGVCQPYVVAQPQYLGQIATDGGHVFYVSTNTGALLEISPTGGALTQLVSSGAEGGFLVVGGGKAFYGASGTTSTLGVATIGVANSGTTLKTIAGNVTGATMNPSATRFLYVVAAGNGGGGANDCAIMGSSCVGAGTFASGPMGPAGGDDNDFFYGNGTVIESEGLGTGSYSTIETRPNTVSNLVADGTYVYWLETNSSFNSSIYRTVESNPTTPTPVALNAGRFVTDGTTVYYLKGNSLYSTPASGGAPATTVATETSYLSYVALSGKLLVWTMADTIYGLVLP